MRGKVGVKQACAIFKNNPKKGFKPSKLEVMVNQDRENFEKVKKGTGRQWCKRLRKRGIIEKKGDLYFLKDDKKALLFLNGKRDKKSKRDGSTPQGGVTLTDNHLIRIEKGVKYPKNVINLWLNMNILHPPNPEDPAQQVTWECESFKIVVSLKTYRGSFYIKHMNYKQKTEELFGSEFKEQIENRVISKHLGITADTLIGFKYRKRGLEVGVDSGSRTGITEIEYKGREELATNGLEQLIRDGVDITIIEQAIFDILEKIERRHTRETHAIVNVVSRSIQTMDYHTKLISEIKEMMKKASVSESYQISTDEYDNISYQ